MDAKDKGSVPEKNPKEITIIVNGRKRSYEREQEIDFDGVVKLAFPR